MPITRDTEKRLDRLEAGFPSPDEARERFLMAQLSDRLESWARGYLRRNPATEPAEFPVTPLAAFLWEPDEAQIALEKFKSGDVANLNGTILKLGKVIFEKEQRAVLARRGWVDPRWQRSTAADQ